ncbi:MAG: ABC transporter ATP-binding protein [Pseudomonadota bacterium]
MTALLGLAGVHAFYGNIEALRGVDLEVRAGEIVTLIGANGAGKSTLLMTVCGNPVAAKGRIVFDGRDIKGAPTHAIIRLGIAQAPEGRRIFARMTVLENLLMGAIAAPPNMDGNGVAADLERAFRLFPLLEERREQSGGTLSGGEQQMLAIARALMSRPRLLLLDEPSLGLAPLLVRQIFDAIARLNRDEGTAILLVEQHAHQALRLAHRGYVMVNGRVALSGGGLELLANPEVRAAYLEGSVGVQAGGGTP